MVRISTVEPQAPDRANPLTAKSRRFTCLELLRVSAKAMAATIAAAASRAKATQALKNHKAADAVPNRKAIRAVRLRRVGGDCDSGSTSGNEERDMTGSLKSGKMIMRISTILPLKGR